MPHPTHGVSLIPVQPWAPYSTLGVFQVEMTPGLIAGKNFGPGKGPKIASSQFFFENRPKYTPKISSVPAQSAEGSFFLVPRGWGPGLDQKKVLTTKTYQ